MLLPDYKKLNRCSFDACRAKSKSKQWDNDDGLDIRLYGEKDGKSQRCYL